MLEVTDIKFDKNTGLFLPDTTRPMAKGYSEAGASLIKKSLKAFTPNSGSPREDIDWNNATLRQRGRMLYMASPVATSAINTNRTSVVGVGLKLQPRVNREVLQLSPEAATAWQRKTAAEFEMWASRKQSCDATGVNNFDGMQQLALISWLMSGDAFALIKRYPKNSTSPYTLRLHLVEADRVATPTDSEVLYSPVTTDGKTEDGNYIYDGVEVDPDGMIVAYHIRNTYPYQLTTAKTDWTRVLAYGEMTGQPNILHIMNSERPDQYRGVTYLAPVIEPLLQLRRYTESELMAALVQSFFTAWVKTTGDPAQLPIAEASEPDPGDLPTDENEYAMEPGQVTTLKPGEEIQFGNPNVPTSGFKDFVVTLSTLIGAALELPKDILLKEFNKSYSASRAALLLAWEAFRMRRKWFVDDFCQPVYEIWLAEAVATGRIKAPGFFNDPLIRAAWCGARWIGPAQGQIDPVKEIKADIAAVGKGFKTHEQVTVEMGGGDWEENVAQLARENELLTAAGGGTAQNLDDGEYPDAGQEGEKTDA
jgi:lambda family phage portal protein